MFYIWSNFGKWNQSNPSKHFGEEPLEWRQYRQIQFLNQVYWKIIFTFETLQVMLKKLKVEGKLPLHKKERRKMYLNYWLNAKHPNWNKTRFISTFELKSSILWNTSSTNFIKISQPYHIDLTTIHFHSWFQKN